ncbi:hypothetical protein [Hymenobacter volaticus]|uniref:Uncharacterized protein n=1 Tax=Hymenobacter volaticus TaxID=2932254 RepID=A0ABY4GFQ6_9BACT|nr:hypothetical protein [Hymenobacter volaticus]UOQ69289.1 hypothetical protein MUN86_27955 [Hymenobacter volaticus]UOQ69319.1 hypothetical protein MUN86_26855 [Hymenobacter volaticus]
MKRKAVFFVASLLVLLGLLVYQLATFSIFDTNPPQLLRQVDPPKTQQRFTLYTIASNATVPNGIQVREVRAGQEVVVGFFPGYTKLVASSTTDQHVRLHLRDTLGNRKDSLITLTLRH